MINGCVHKSGPLGDMVHRAHFVNVFTCYFADILLRERLLLRGIAKMAC